MLTVTTPATTFDLITLASVKSVLGIVNGSDDAFLKDAITQASDVIARHCKRVFAAETVEETFRLDQSHNDLVLARYPVTSIVSIVEGVTEFDLFNTDDMNRSLDYELNGESGVLRRLGGDGTRDGWWAATRIVVAYKAGFDLPTAAPEALKKAATRLTKAYWDTADRDLSLRSADISGVGIQTYLDFEHLPYDAEALLVPFRNLRIV